MNPHLKALLDAGKTPTEIADLCGVKLRTVKGWQYGRRVNASAEIILIREWAHEEACKRERERPRTPRELELLAMVADEERKRWQETLDRECPQLTTAETPHEKSAASKCGCGGLCDSKEPCPMAENA